MKKSLYLLTVAGFIFLAPGSAFAGDIFKPVNRGLKDLDILALAVSPVNPNLAYIGSGRRVYKTEDAGRNWQIALNLKGSNKGINFLSFNRKEPEIIYAATQDGLFVNNGPDSDTWVKLFSGVGEDEKFCRCVLAEGKEIFLGTQAGLFISFDGARRWDKAQGEIGSAAIDSIELGGERVFVSSADKLFASSDAGKTWQRVFNFGLRKEKDAQDDGSLEGEDDAGAALEDELPDASYVFIPVDEPQKIYLATASGVFMSPDNGLTFTASSPAGLGARGIRNIVVHLQNIYAATQKGIFVLEKDKEAWQNLYAGLESRDARFISRDSLGRLWLATDKGVFRTQEAYNAAGGDTANMEDWQLYFKDEPTVGEIHSAAIKYAEVIDPKRIENLRRGARLRALIPDVGLDYDKTLNFGSSTSPNYYTGPQDWSLGLSWDLGDLIWSDQQRLIDSQVRLMVELREDMLSEATRLYFERRRLQVELLTLPPADLRMKMEKELRLEELTASLDALTGGYLSRQLGRPN